MAAVGKKALLPKAPQRSSFHHFPKLARRRQLWPAIKKTILACEEAKKHLHCRCGGFEFVSPTGKEESKRMPHMPQT